MFFRKKKTPPQVGAECAQTFAVLISQIIDGVSALVDSSNEPFTSIKNINKDLLIRACHSGLCRRKACNSVCDTR